MHKKIKCGFLGHRRKIEEKQFIRLVGSNHEAKR